MEELPVSGKMHKISSNNRKNCSVTGVTDVISFDLNYSLNFLCGNIELTYNKHKHTI